MSAGSSLVPPCFVWFTVLMAAGKACFYQDVTNGKLVYFSPRCHTDQASRSEGLAAVCSLTEEMF